MVCNASDLLAPGVAADQALCTVGCVIDPAAASTGASVVTLGSALWGPSVYRCVGDATSQPTEGRVRPGRWVPTNATGSAWPAGAPSPPQRCLHVFAVLGSGSSTLETCGEVGQLIWPPLQLGGTVLRLAERAQPWANDTHAPGFASEAVSQATLAARLAGAPAPYIELVATFLDEQSGAAPAAPSAASPCGLPAVVMQTAGGASRAVFRFRDGSVLRNRTAAAVGCLGGGGAVVVSLHAQAPPWDARFSGAAVSGAAAWALPPVPLGRALPVVGGASLTPLARARGSNNTCRTLDAALELGASSDAPPTLRGWSVISDGLPPVFVRLTVPVPLSPRERLVARCGLIPSSRVDDMSAVASVVPEELVLSRATASATFSVVPRFQGLTLGVVRSPAAYTWGSLRCDVARVSDAADELPAYQERFNISWPLVFIPAPWPFYEDAIVSIPSTRGWNGTGAGAVQQRRVLRSSGSSSSSPSSRFEILVWSPVNVTLVPDHSAWLSDRVYGHFGAQTEVLVGALRARTWFDTFTGALTFEAPPYEAICGGGGAAVAGDCPTAIRLRHALSPDVPSYSVEVSCPPFCPDGSRKGADDYPVAVATRAEWRAAGGGAVVTAPRGRVLQAVAPSGGQAVLARASSVLPAQMVSSESLREGLLLVSAPPPASGGILYISDCTKYDNTTIDPRASGVCRNSSDPLSRNCVRGLGSFCTRCPPNALCPGGNRVWPRPGFFATGDSDPAAILPCSAPSVERCAGWDEARNRSLCGLGYAAGSYLCDACADGYFPADGACLPCSPAADGSIRAVAVAVIYLLLGIAGAAAAVVGVTRLVIALVTRGGTVRQSLVRVRQLALWLISTFQLQLLVAESATTGLPSYVLRIYAFLKVFALDLGAGHPVCVGRWATFRAPVAFFSLAALVVAAALLVFVPWRRLCGCVCCGLRRVEMRLLFEQELAPDARADAKGAAGAGGGDGGNADDGDDGGGNSGDGDGKTGGGDVGGGSRAGSSSSPLGADAAPPPEPPSTSRAARLRALLARCRRGCAPPPSEEEQRRARDAAARRKRRAAVLNRLSGTMRMGVRVAEAKPKLRKLVLTAATLLYPGLLGSVMDVLHCETRTQLVSNVRTMMGDGSTLHRLGIPVVPPARRPDGDAAGWTDPDAGRLVSVDTLVAHRFVICREGLHRSVWGAALGVVVVFVVGYPALSLVMVALRLRKLMRDCEPGYQLSVAGDWERQRAFRRDAPDGATYAARLVLTYLCCAGKRYTGGPRAGTTAGATDGGAWSVQNPLHSRAGAHLKRAADAPTLRAVGAPPGEAPPDSTAEKDAAAMRPPAPPLTASDVIDASAVVRDDDALSYFVMTDFRPSAFAMRHLDLLLALCMAAASRLWPVGTVGALVGRAVFVWAALAVTAGVYLVHRPYIHDNRFFLWLKLLSFLVVACIAAVNLAAAAVNLRTAGASVGDADSAELAALVRLRDGLSALTVAVSAGFLLAVVGAFAWSIYDGLEREAAGDRAHAAERAAAVAAGERADPPIEGEGGVGGGERADAESQPSDAAGHVVVVNLGDDSTWATTQLTYDAQDPGAPEDGAAAPEPAAAMQGALPPRPDARGTPARTRSLRKLDITFQGASLGPTRIRTAGAGAQQQPARPDEAPAARAARRQVRAPDGEEVAGPAPATPAPLRRQGTA